MTTVNRALCASDNTAALSVVADTPQQAFPFEGKVAVASTSVCGARKNHRIRCCSIFSTAAQRFCLPASAIGGGRQRAHFSTLFFTAFSTVTTHNRPKEFIIL